MVNHSLLRATGWLLLFLFLLLACGIYSQLSWNLAFLGLALILLVPLLCLPKPRKALPDTSGTERPSKRICLVIGPYAANWFASQRGTEALRYDETTVWFAARDALELIRLLNQFSSPEHRQSVTLFFPFLPDGHDTTALASESLMSWQKTLQMLVLAEPLPCIFTIYARCSQQRYAHDPDRAVWTELAFSSGESLERAMSALVEQFASQDTATEGYQLQRQTTLSMLQLWMQETNLLPVLNGLLNSSSVRLQQIMLSDYGHGFIRHGAWSRWLEETYAILPALARSRIELPLPELAATASQDQTSEPVLRARPRSLWLPAVTLLLAASMCAAFAWEQHRQAVVKGMMQQIKRLPGDDIAGQFAAVRRLEKLEPQLTHCADSYPFQNWGFSQCVGMLPKVDTVLEKYERWVTFSSAGPISLFASGHAELIPSLTDRLLPAAAMVEKNPGVIFLIVGHSDSSGDENNNLSLSLARAQAVRDWIISRTSVPVERFRLKGMGDAFPVISNDTPEGKEMNRRVEMIPLRSPSYIPNSTDTAK